MPDSKVDPQKATECETCRNCSNCGYDEVMHECPIENSDIKDASYKMFKPRIEADGRSFQDELQTVECTPSQLVLQLARECALMGELLPQCGGGRGGGVGGRGGCVYLR